MADQAKADSEQAIREIGDYLKRLNAHLKTKKGRVEMAQRSIELYKEDYLESIRERVKKDQAASARPNKTRQRLPHRIVIGNPLYPWYAFLECQSAGLPIPDWVLEYFREVALAIDQFAKFPSQERIKNYESTITEIFGFKAPGKGGRGNIVSKFFDNRDLTLGIQVKLQVASGSQVTYACQDVAKENKVSEPTVRRAWKKYQQKYQQPSTPS